VGEHRDSIPEGAGPAGQPSHIFPPSMCFALRHPSKETVVTVAPMAKKDSAVEASPTAETVAAAQEAPAEEAAAPVAPPTPTAVLDLIRELDHAFNAPPKPGRERDPFIEVLVAVARLARAAGLREAQWGLTELAYALQDLDVGRVAPVVRPTKRKGGSPPDSSVTWIMRVRVLSALDALQRSGMTQEKARSYINSNYPKLGRLMSRGRDLPGTIKRWQRELGEAKKGSFLAPFAQQLFDTMKDTRNISAPMSMTPDRWRQVADNMLARIQP